MTLTPAVSQVADASRCQSSALLLTPRASSEARGASRCVVCRCRPARLLRRDDADRCRVANVVMLAGASTAAGFANPTFRLRRTRPTILCIEATLFQGGGPGPTFSQDSGAVCPHAAVARIQALVSKYIASTFSSDGGRLVDAAAASASAAAADSNKTMDSPFGEGEGWRVEGSVVRWHPLAPPSLAFQICEDAGRSEKKFRPPVIAHREPVQPPQTPLYTDSTIRAIVKARLDRFQSPRSPC
jgi:hypothetical protein